MCCCFEVAITVCSVQCAVCNDETNKLVFRISGHTRTQTHEPWYSFRKGRQSACIIIVMSHEMCNATQHNSLKSFTRRHISIIAIAIFTFASPWYILRMIYICLRIFMWNSDVDQIDNTSVCMYVSLYQTTKCRIRWVSQSLKFLTRMLFSSDTILHVSLERRIGWSFGSEYKRENIMTVTQTLLSTRTIRSSRNEKNASQT